MNENNTLEIIYSERISLSPLLLDGIPVEPGFMYHDQEHARWLSTSVTIPEEWAGERVGLHLSFQGEPLLYVDGIPFQALDYNHSHVLLHDPAQGGETHDLKIEIYAGTAGFDVTIRSLELVRVNREAWKAQFDQMANAIVAQGVSFDGVQPTITCIGHSHLDLAYLWALPNTRKKVGRTWASALRLLDEYPNFCFTQSQGFLYDVVKNDYPDLWQQVKTRVADNRWEVTGGMWVEPDANIPSGESLVRQILYGQAFLQKEFGKTAKVMWLPDTFGFPATFPQILAGCGIEYFLTAKLSWNDTNRFPHDTFRWRGSDGASEVLAHVLTAPEWHTGLQKSVHTYNGLVSHMQLAGAWEEYAQKNVQNEVIHTFGYGDGGGGPTREMVEVLNRLGDFPEFPQCQFGRADTFFERLSQNRPAFPTWRGELYLENHRGTLTSQAFLKRANRFSEILLRNAEMFSVLAEVEVGLPFPIESLNGAWKTLLTNQFHDILAGTVVPQAVADARQDFATLTTTGEEVLQNALQAIAERIPVKEDSFVIFNPTDTLRPSDVVRVTVPANVVKSVEFGDATDALLPSQFLSVDKKGNRDYLVSLSNLGALGYQTITAYKSLGPQEESTVFAEIDGENAILENEFVQVTLNANGEVLSFLHKLSDGDDDEPDAIREREVIAEGERGNVLAVYTDKPASYDAWNIDRETFSTRTNLSDMANPERFAVIEEGPVRAGVEVIQRFGNSTITQRLYLYSHSPRLEVQTIADWHEHQTLLCVHFPVAVNADRATYSVQYGAIERSTHENTSFDAARFEVAHHHWMDLSEGDYGVSVLNDCKYGGCVRDKDIRLTLIKSGIRPDPEADQGTHLFTYALFPHTGDFRNETVDEAYALNYPLLSKFIRKGEKRKTPALPDIYALATVNDQGLVIDTIKRAEDGDGYIVRLFEAFNTRGTATLTLGFDIAEAFVTNLLEVNQESIPVMGGGDIPFTYTPNEIKTFRIRRR